MKKCIVFIFLILFFIACGQEDSVIPEEDDDDNDISFEEDDDATSIPDIEEFDWRYITFEADPEGDNNSYMFDIEQMYYRTNYYDVEFKITSWSPFVLESLIFDIVTRSPNSIYWFFMTAQGETTFYFYNEITTEDGEFEPDKFYFEAPDEKTLIVGVDLESIGITEEYHSMLLSAGVGGNWFSYYDEMPDNFSSELGMFTISLLPPEAEITVDSIDIDDSQGNGDGQVNVGEEFSLIVTIQNTGDFVTGENLTGTISILISYAEVEILEDTALFNDGLPVSVGEYASTTPPHFVIHVMEGSEVGDWMVFNLEITDDDGNLFGATTPTVVVY